MAVKQIAPPDAEVELGLIEVEAEHILATELQILHDRPMRLVGFKKVSTFNITDVKKKVVINSHIRPSGVAEFLGVTSTIEFWLASGVWMPRILNLKIGDGAILHFITIEEEEGGGISSYTIDGPVPADRV